MLAARWRLSVVGVFRIDHRRGASTAHTDTQLLISCILPCASVLTCPDYPDPVKVTSIPSQLYNYLKFLYLMEFLIIKTADVLL